MSLYRHLSQLLLAWLGGVWVFYGGDALWRGSWTAAAWALGATAALAGALVVLIVQDARGGRLRLRRR